MQKGSDDYRPCWCGGWRGGAGRIGSWGGERKGSNFGFL